MKKLIPILLASLFAIALIGCSQGNGSASSSPIEPPSDGGALETLSTPGNDQGSSLKPSSTSEPVVTGTYYTRNALVDQQLGVDVFSAFLPQGWTASITSDWSITSAATPGLESITLTSPDSKAKIDISSRMDFVQQASGQEGSSFEYYTNYLNYRDAAEFTDMYMNNTYGSSATLVSELPEDTSTTELLRQLATTAATEFEAAGMAVTDGGSIGSTTVTAQYADATMCRRQYQVQDQYLETTATDYAFDATIASSVLAQNYRYWRIPFSIVYSATSKDAFDKYYDDYTMIVANSYFTPNYYNAEEYISSVIAAVAMDAKAAAISDGTSFFSKSSYESATGESTNEKIINMWDDVINEVDAYRTLDGDLVKTSMYNDVVAQSGDEFFVGPSTSDIPSGFTELTRGY